MQLGEKEKAKAFLSFSLAREKGSATLLSGDGKEGHSFELSFCERRRRRSEGEVKGECLCSRLLVLGKKEERRRAIWGIDLGFIACCFRCRRRLTKIRNRLAPINNVGWVIIV